MAYSVVSDQNGLVNGDQCAIDAKLISALGANVVRAYTVDPTLDHSKCMQAFADVGIYVLVDMSTPTYAINRVRNLSGATSCVAKLIMVTGRPQVDT